MMMAENLIYYTEKLCKSNNEYYVETNDDINIERLKEATGIDRIKRVNRKELFIDKYGKLRYTYLASIVGKDVKSTLLRSMDRVYFLGGDDFTQIYGKKQLIECLLFINAIKDKNNYVGLIGQSIGPFDKGLEKLAMMIFKRMDLISLRDPESYQYLKQKGLNNIEKMADLALLPLAKETNVVVNDRSYVLVCPSEIMYMYAKTVDRLQFILLNKKLCEYILEQNPGLKIILLPHVTRDRTGGDGKMLDDIYEHIDPKYLDRIIKMNKEILPFKVRELIKHSKFVVAERMHPAISAIVCEVPSVVFSYGRKYRGIFEKIYKLSDTVLDITKYSDYNVMWKDLKSIVDYVNKNYEELSYKIRCTNKLTQPAVLNHIKKLNSIEINNSGKSDIMKYSTIRKKYQEHDYLNKVFVDPYAMLISPLFTKIFIRFNVIPNYVTLLMIISGIIGALFFSLNNFIFKIIGVIFIHIWYILDCSDGEVARITKKFSRFGKEMDFTAHVINHPLFNLSFAITVILNNKNNVMFSLFLFLILISVNLMIRNIHSFHTIYALKTNSGNNKTGSPKFKQVIGYIQRIFVEYPNFALIFPIIYLIELKTDTSIWLIYLGLQTGISVITMIRMMYKWIVSTINL